MTLERRYRIGDFARLAGITVRALHFYDQKGLVRPQRSESGQRWYRRADLLRLQQVLMLKSMGFSLDEIRRLLSSRAFSVKRSLEIQRAALSGRIAGLEAAARAIDLALEALKTDGEEAVDWTELTQMIKGATRMDNTEWIKKYYTPEQEEQLAERRKLFADEDLKRAEQEWARLFEEFGARRHLSPEHPEVQALAARAHELIELFTGGDPSIRDSLNRMYADQEQMPAEYRMADRELMEFYGRALAVYEAGANKA